MATVMVMVTAIATVMVILTAMVIIIMDIHIDIPIDTPTLHMGEIIITNQGIDPVISDEMKR